MAKLKTPPGAPPAWPFGRVTLVIHGETWAAKLTPHKSSGQWRKKHNGREYYFGPLHDPQAAFDRWRAEWPQIVKGQPRDAAPSPTPGTVTLKTLGERFLESKRAKVERGELQRQTFRDYRQVARWMTKILGGDRLVDHLRPHDFDRLLEAQTDDKPKTRIERIRRVRIIFKWGWEAGHLDKPVRFGPDFRAARPAELRRMRAAEPPRLVRPDRIRAALRLTAGDDPWVRAYLLLGINGGFGISDLFYLPRSAWDGGDWIDGTRHKSGAPRIVPLWPETRAALTRAAGDDPKGLLLPNQFGRGRSRMVASQGLLYPMLMGGWGDRRFYDLRRTFATIGVETGDEVAVKVIMGQVVDGEVLHVYVQRFPKERLLRVTQRVRSWLYSRS